MGRRLEGKVAVVTGGGNGIGRSCCERFAAEGADVVVADLLDEAGAATVATLEDKGARARFVHLDAASPADNEALMDAAVETFGGIDVLVTAAGISHGAYRSGDREADLKLLARTAEALQDPPRGFVDANALEGWQKVLDVNLTGTFLALHAAARRMIDAQRPGSIITLGSVASKQPEAGPIAYAVSKAGVWMLTKHAARSLAPAGIRVNCVGPGYIKTHMTAILTELPMVADQLKAAIPMGRVGRPEEVAATALFLATDESSYFTGEILHPDGGYYTD